LFLLQIIEFEKIRKNCSYIIIHKSLYTFLYTIPLNLIICKKNDAKIILLIIFYVFSLLLFFFLYQTVILLKKEGYEYIHSEKKVVPATKNLRINSASTMCYKVVITTMNK